MKPKPTYLIKSMGYVTPCWIWYGASDKDGYGLYSVNKHKTIRAHRYFYIKHKGDFDHSLQIHHLCHIKACVNPDHLEPVTFLENIRRIKKEWRAKYDNKQPQP